MNSDTTQSARGFLDFTEATTTVLDLLEKQLDNCAVFVAYHDVDAQLLRIVDFRGDGDFGLSNGQTLALSANARPDGAPIDPGNTILASPDVHGINSFVGVPLVLDNDTHFGTLCAIAATPQRLGHNEVELMTVLGRVIVNELDGELKEQEYQQRHEDLVQHNKRLRVDAFTDPLTGVANRRGFERTLTREWKLSRRGTVSSFLVLLDLDGFKAVNDNFGHSTGDTVLKLCGQALRDAGRETDIVGRIGGDEFAVILTGCGSADEAMVFRERAHSRLEELLAEAGARVSFSAGHQALADSPSPLRAMELADQAMYWQKRQRAGRLPRGGDLATKIKGSPDGAFGSRATSARRSLTSHRASIQEATPATDTQSETVKAVLPEIR